MREGLLIALVLAWSMGCTETAVDGALVVEGDAFELGFVAFPDGAGQLWVIGTNSNSPCVAPFPPPPEGEELVAVVVNAPVSPGVLLTSPDGDAHIYGYPLRLYLARGGLEDSVLLQTSAAGSGYELTLQLTFTERIASTGEKELDPAVTLSVENEPVGECGSAMP